MVDPNLSAKLDAAWGDPDAWVANGLQWTHLKEIQRAINRRVSADPAVDSLEWFVRHASQAGAALPLQRVLVLGCGSGRIERELHAHGWAREIVGFDLSPKVLDLAKAAAANIPSIHYVLASMDDLPVGEGPFQPGSFDAVVGVASVHHCSQLEQLYAGVHRMLKPTGWFFLDEYVGPARFGYSQIHMDQVCALAELLPDRLLRTASGAVRRGFRAPTVAEVVAVDPSEAVRSSEILPLLPAHFEVVAQRPYGGSLLQVLLAEVAQNFEPPEAKPWLQALMDVEEELDRLGRLEHHFCCVIARPLQEAGGASSTPRNMRPKTSGS